jgi:SAM-dependent methyltransferase
MNGLLRCPLCDAPGAVHFHRDRRREYLRCIECSLVFVPPGYHLDREQEKAEYDLHQNTLDDSGYRRFLARLADPLLASLPAGARGLDFGCGPGPALAAMLVEAGCEVSLYDVFYEPDPEALEQSYQFITATEVVEHLRHPGAELSRLWQMLEPGGCLGVMTKLVIDAAAFATWHYKSDPTHISFFSDRTWRWWAENVDARLERIGSDVALLYKN